MEQNTRLPEPGSQRAQDHPAEIFLTVQRLLRKLGLSPADGLQLLAEVLEDLDRQIDERESRADAAFPLWVVGERPDGGGVT